MSHKWLSTIRKMGGSAILVLAQLAIAGFIFYLAFGFLLSLAGALLGFIGIKNSSFWLKGLVVVGTLAGFVIVLMGTVLGTVFRVTGDLPKTANAFFQRVADDNLSEAYQLTSQSFQTRVPTLEFFQFAQTELPQPYKKSVWSSRSIDNDRGKLKGTIHTQSGDQVPIEIDLIQEQGIWKIHVLHLGSQRVELDFTATGSAASFTPLPEALTQAIPDVSPDIPNDLQDRLMRMMSGDRAAAQRLLTHARSKYPGHLEIWYWEKVITDLERDRSL